MIFFIRKANNFRKSTLLFFCLISLSYKCQSNRTKTDPYFTLGIIYNQNLYTSPFNSQINSISIYKFGMPVNSVGVTIPNTYFAFNPGYTYRGVISLTKIIPSIISINDSLKTDLNGFTYSMDLLTMRFFKKNKKIISKTGIGFNTGQVKLNTLNKRNIYFAPQISTFNGYAFYNWFLGISASYCYDISDAKWKNTLGRSSTEVSIKPFNQTKFIISICVGWIF